jgi:hypothetical protein
MLRGTSFTDVGLMPLPLYDRGFNLETYPRRTRHPLHVNNSHFVLCGTCRAVYARLVNQIIIRFILNQIIIRFFPLPLIQSMRTLEMNLCACLHTHTYTHTFRYVSISISRRREDVLTDEIEYADVCWRMLA